jgi:hypothetical protein
LIYNRLWDKVVYKGKIGRLNELIFLLVSLTIQRSSKVNSSDNNVNSTSHFTSQSGVESKKTSTQQDAKCLELLGGAERDRTVGLLTASTEPLAS